MKTLKAHLGTAKKILIKLKSGFQILIVFSLFIIGIYIFSPFILTGLFPEVSDLLSLIQSEPLTEQIDLDNSNFNILENSIIDFKASKVTIFKNNKPFKLDIYKDFDTCEKNFTKVPLSKYYIFYEEIKYVLTPCLPIAVSQ